MATATLAPLQARGGTSYVASAISPRRGWTPEKFLVCLGSAVARTGEQTYRGSEIGLPELGEITAYRGPEDLLREDVLASGESKPITYLHPPTFLDSANVSTFGKGHMRNLRVAPELSDGEGVILADLVIVDPVLADLVANNVVNGLSLGYHCVWQATDDEGKNWRQSRFVINHAAVVPLGRGGTEIRISDSMEGGLKVDELLRHAMDKVDRAVRARTLADEVSRTESDGNFMAALMRSGMGAGSMAEALRQRSADYVAFEREADAGKSFENSINDFGRRLRERQ